MQLSGATIRVAVFAPLLPVFGFILPAGCCRTPDGIGRFERYPCDQACTGQMAVGARVDLTTILDQMTVETTVEGRFVIEAHPRFVRVLASATGSATALVKQGDALFDYFPLRAAEAGALHVEGVATSSITLTLGTERSLKVTALAETGSGAPGSAMAGSFCLTPYVEGAPNTVAAPCDESEPATASGGVLTLTAETVGTSTVTIYALGLHRAFVFEVQP